MLTFALDYWFPRVVIAAIVYASFIWIVVTPKPEERQMLRFFIDRRRSA